MKRLLILTALLPFVGFAQPINTLNNPNQPGYQIPSQQRMQTQMQTQQIQQKGMLNQQLKTQTQLQQQHLENQINNNSQVPGGSIVGRRHIAQQANYCRAIICNTRQLTLPLTLLRQR